MFYLHEFVWLYLYTLCYLMLSDIRQRAYFVQFKIIISQWSVSVT